MHCRSAIDPALTHTLLSAGERLYDCQRQPSPIVWDDSKTMSSRVLFQFIWNIRVSGWRNSKKPDCQQSRSEPTSYLQVGATLWRGPEKTPKSLILETSKSTIFIRTGVLPGFGSGLIGLPAEPARQFYGQGSGQVPMSWIFQSFYDKIADIFARVLKSIWTLFQTIIDWHDRTHVDIWL